MASSPVPILFITNAEYGQANVILAVAQELAFDPAFQVHVSSFDELEVRVNQINKNVRIASPIQFHGVAVVPMAELIKRHKVTMPHAPGIPGAIPSFMALNHSILGWEKSEYMTAYHAFYNVIESVKPAALVMEPGIWMAHDAARTLGLNYLILTPSSAKELSASAMPQGSFFWKYPFAGSGYSYPMSFFEGLKSVFLGICAITAVIRTGYLQQFNKTRKEAGITHSFPMFDMNRADDLILTPYLPEIDYPYAKLVPNLVACGPIVLPPTDLHEEDADLAKWIEQDPVVLINLGTHFTSDAQSTVEQAKGIKGLLDARAGVRVLWKVKYDWSNNSEIVSLVGPLIESGRLRITAWLQSEPSSLLETNRIVCSVHHGGANSYYEACRAGVPQVILPVWWDTYEYAARAEWLGIGIIGNRGVAPGVQGTQFGDALARAVQDEALQTKARELGEACRRREGRRVAADEVARWAANGSAAAGANAGAHA